MHLSTLAGTFEYNDVKLHPKFTRLEFELEDAQSLTVIISVCILMGAYFYLLIYAVQKNEVRLKHILIRVLHLLTSLSL